MNTTRSLTASCGCAARARAAIAAALLLAGAAAQAETYAFGGTGTVVPTAPPTGSVQPLLATSASGYIFVGGAGYGLAAPFTFDMAGGGGSGSFTISRGDDVLSGTLLTAMGAPGTFELAYTVTAGAGLFAGATGSGNTVVLLTGSDGGVGYTYTESGRFDLTLAPVPEPAGWALMAAGVTLLLRRRLGPHAQP